MRGRKPKPTALRVLQGNAGKRPLPLDEPAPRATALDPPAYLTDEARAEWARVAPMLERLGIFTEADVSAMVGYCEAWSRWRKAETTLATSGLLIKAPSGYPVVNPLVGVANKAMQQMRAFLVEFGMTPSARTRVQVLTGEHEGAFQRFLSAKARGRSNGR